MLEDRSAPENTDPVAAGFSRRRRCMVWIAVALAPAVVVATVVGVRAALTVSGGELDIVALDRPAPTFDLADLRDPRARLTLKGFEGPLVVNFWASWCVPCREEMDGFERMYRARGEDVTIVGIDTRDDRGDALALARKVGVTYPLAFDTDGGAARRYGVVGLPSTVFIDATGTMRGRRLGAMSADELSETIDRLLLQ